MRTEDSEHLFISCSIVCLWQCRVNALAQTPFKCTVAGLASKVHLNATGVNSAKIATKVALVEGGKFLKFAHPTGSFLPKSGPTRASYMSKSVLFFFNAGDAI